jgi:hypothetical protein
MRFPWGISIAFLPALRYHFSPIFLYKMTPLGLHFAPFFGNQGKGKRLKLVFDVLAADCSMPKKISLFPMIALLLALFMPSFPVVAEEAYLSDVVVTNTHEHLLVYFTVNDSFTPEMKKAVESGIETTFTFIVELSEKRTYWWDREITRIKVRHSIKYDNLKRRYLVQVSENGGEPVSFNDLEEAMKLMTHVAALKVTSLGKLKRGTYYQLRMMAELDKIELPFYLHYVLFFISMWDFKTDWYTIDFRY